MDVENLAKELILKNMTPEQQMAVLDSVRQSVLQAKEVQKKKIGENVDLVVQALKKIESDITTRFESVGNSIEKRVLSIKDGRDGSNGKDGRDGKDGKSGRDGLKGDKGVDGQAGRDGVDGIDGISVVNANIDFDGSLIISLSDGRELNVGEVVSADIAEKIKVISTMSTNGAVGIKDEGTSISTGVKNINFVGAAVTATNSGDDVTVNVSSGTGTVTSVAATAGTGISVSGSPITTSGTLTITNTAPDQTVSLTASTGISTSGTYPSFTITNSAPDQTVALTQGGTTTITGTYPNFTISSADQFSGTVTSVAASVPAFLSVTGSPVTTSGTLAIGLSGTALPVLNGGTGATTANAAMANLMGFTSTVTAAGTTTLTNTSSYYQLFTGTTTQTVVLPVTSTLQTGWTFHLCNNSTGTVTVNSSGGNLVISVIAGTTVMCTCIGTTLTTAADWEAGYTDFSTLTGSGSVVLSSGASLTAPSFSSPTASGTMLFVGTAGSASSFHTTQTTGTLTVGGTAGTGNIIVGRSTVSQQTDIQAGATASGSTKTINFGSGGLAGSTTAITIGSTAGTSTTTLNGTTTLANALVSSAGTAALPAITTTGDTNTGIFFPAADTIAFSEGGAEAMRIDSSGNVGIGTSSPSTRLHVEQSTTGDAFKVARGGNYLIMGGSGSGTQYVKGYEGVVAFGNAFAGATTFLTGDTERMRIDSSGNLLVGTTSTLGGRLSVKTSGATNAYFTNDTAGGYNLECDSQSNGGTYYFVNFRKLGTGISNITSNGTTIAYNTGSDYRLKENIQPITNALDKVSQLKPCKWDWQQFWGEGSSQGFVAHELQEVVPDCVTGAKDVVDLDGNPVYQGVDSSFLVATLTAAIQEQQAIITALTARITALENK